AARISTLSLYDTLFLSRSSAPYTTSSATLFSEVPSAQHSTRPIIETLVDLARNMRIEIFAEGVETFEQVKFLRERGVYLCQGYVFAPPLAGPLFRQLLE